MYLRWEPKIESGVHLMSCVMVGLLLNQSMSCHGVNAALLSLISMVYVGGLRFSAEYCFLCVKERKKIRLAKQGGKMFSTIIGTQLTDIYTVGFVYLFEKQREFIPDLR